MEKLALRKKKKQPSPVKRTEAEFNFFVFHGGLSQGHTPEAQAFMASRGYANRQMQITSSTRDKVHIRYRDKLVGDNVSPVFDAW
jgi:hypothetical protein